MQDRWVDVMRRHACYTGYLGYLGYMGYMGYTDALCGVVGAHACSQPHPTSSLLALHGVGTFHSRGQAEFPACIEPPPV